MRVQKRQNPAGSSPAGLLELRGQDLNLRPSGYEPDELPDCSTPRRGAEDSAHAATGENQAELGASVVVVVPPPGGGASAPAAAAAASRRARATRSTPSL